MPQENEKHFVKEGFSKPQISAKDFAEKIELWARREGLQNPNITQKQNIDLAKIIIINCHNRSFFDGYDPNSSVLKLCDLNLTTIPPEIGDLPKLKILNLAGNNLAEIPSQIGDLTSLQILDLHQNNLRELPLKIGYLKDLEKIDLSENKFTEVPQSIINLHNLKMLNLGQNKLTKLPEEIGNLTDLRILNLAGNDFSELPEGLDKKLVNLNSFSKRELLNIAQEIIDRKANETPSGSSSRATSDRVGNKIQISSPRN